MPRLVFIDQFFAGQVVELRGEKTSIGRSDKNGLAIRHESVSSQHGEILVNGPEVIVRDFQSRNGTFVNGIRVQQQTQVKSGQTVRFGSVEARLELGRSDEDHEDTDITAVRAHARSERDSRRAQKAPPPATAPARLDSNRPLEPSDQGDDGEMTILIPNAPAPQKGPATEWMNRPSNAAPQSGSGVGVLLIGVGVLALLVLVWYFWARK